MFTLRIGTVMEGSKLLSGFGSGYLPVHDQPQGPVFVKLYRELGIGQKAAWFLMQRLRTAFGSKASVFSGPVEVDEIYVGGRRSNMSNARRKELKGPDQMAVVVSGMEQKRLHYRELIADNGLDSGGAGMKQAKTGRIS